MSAESEKPKTATPIDTDAPKEVASTYPIATYSLWEFSAKKASGQAEAVWAPSPKSVTPYEDLIPKTSQESDRRTRVAAHIARGVLTQSNFRNPSDEYRPQTLRENIMAFRLGDKKLKADILSLQAEKIATPYLETVTETDPQNPKRTKAVKRPNFRSDDPNLSARERRVARKDEKRYKKLQSQVGRLMTGRTIPLTDRPVMGFEQIVRPGETRRDRS
jgi:hypothetical protein